MKKTTLFLLALLIAIPCFAADQKTELTGGASYFKPDGGNAVWALSAEVSFPLTSFIRVGPAVEIINAEEDFQAFGGLVELDFMGDSGLFAAAIGLYDPEAPEGLDSHTLDVRGGFRHVIGGGGLLKFYLEKTVDGYGKSEDLVGAAAFGVRF